MKVWMSVNDQVQKHLNRGLDLGEISRKEFALFLYSNNYYRVSGYSHCLFDRTTTPLRYQSGVTASHLMEMCELDRRVRNLVLDGISVVETTVRSRVAYHVCSIIQGSEDYLNQSFYLPEDAGPNSEDDRNWFAQVENRNFVLSDFGYAKSRDEPFVQHYVSNGEDLPLWVAIEVISIGTFSRFIKGMRDQGPLAPVAKSLEIEDTKMFLQAIHNLTYLRNIAAHHGRLWNRKLSGSVALPDIALRVKREYLHYKSPAALITLLAGMVDQIEQDSSFSTNLFDLVYSNEDFAQGYHYPIL